MFSGGVYKAIYAILYYIILISSVLISMVQTTDVHAGASQPDVKRQLNVSLTDEQPLLSTSYGLLVRKIQYWLIDQA